MVRPKRLTLPFCTAVLTEAGKRQLLTRPELAHDPAPITVIPCCVDFAHFPLADQGSREAARNKLGLGEEGQVLVYLGSLGSWYMLGEMLDFFKVFAARHPHSRFLFVTTDDAQAIRQAALDRGIDPDAVLVQPATREEVPQLMAAADLMSLHGAITLKGGRVEQSNFPNYDVLRMADCPAIEVHLVESGWEHLGGVGEPGTPPIAPAVANAVFAATGKRVRELPIRLG